MAALRHEEVDRVPIEAGPEAPDEPAERLTAANYWIKPLEALQRGE